MRREKQLKHAECEKRANLRECERRKTEDALQSNRKFLDEEATPAALSIAVGEEIDFGEDVGLTSLVEHGIPCPLLCLSSR